MTDIINETQNFSIIGCHYLNEKNFIPAGFFDTKKNNDFRVNYKEIIEFRKNCLKAEDVKRTHLDQHSNREGA